MSELIDLYQDLILDHNRQPRNRGTLDPADRAANGHNPLCGDRVHITLILDGDVVKDIRFEGNGCAISTASASLMSEAVRGKTVTEAKAIFERFHDVVTHGDPEGTAMESLGKLAAFTGVSRFPARVKCATLAWHTLIAALDEAAAPVTTE